MSATLPRTSPLGARTFGDPPSELTRRLIRKGLEPRNIRQDRTGPLRLMASAEGYVMVRRPGAMPFVIAEKDWLSLPEQERAA
jgi:hypothetical protein